MKLTNCSLETFLSNGRTPISSCKGLNLASGAGMVKRERKKPGGKHFVLSNGFPSYKFCLL